MNHEQASRLIRQTFEHPYDEDRFRLFARNLLSSWREETGPPQSGAQVSEAFRDTVSQLKRLGRLEDGAGLQIDVLAVKLKSGMTLERARTAQRNFIARYLENQEHDAGLVAFYSDDEPGWRFSLVKLELHLGQSATGQAQVKKTLTPARRFSFLVGPGEGSHTAQRRLVTLLESELAPSLAELELAFNIETVTEEFFESYKTLFLQLRDDLDQLAVNDPKVEVEFTAHGIDTATFAKRLMGQLVFLYFIQKKGWLGVGKEERWGDGPRDFLQQLYSGQVVTYQNFFDDVLEPLFYQGLANDRSAEDHYFSHFDCRIPFLNGGLFEPMNGYDWVKVPVLLPNAHLEDVLRTFDLYNFTVQEDSPLDKEVAVDPEMLGKVFENLLEVTDRKSKGAFYTPREIVHFMAQESLIHYLDRGVNMTEEALMPVPQEALFNVSTQPKLTAAVYDARVPVADLSAFVRYVDLTLENDAITAAKGQETAAYSFKLPETVRGQAGLLDDLLSRVKVIDPAIGSGAFPVGMLTEIVRCRMGLTPFLGPVDPETRSAYALKRHAIHENIYGVDIDAAAIDVAKLRLWLSLVVDEVDFNTIKPLPNLDYKIVVGSSMGRIQGLGQFDQKGEIARLKAEFFDESRASVKKKLRHDIGEALKGFYTNARQWGHTADFEFHAEFSEVFTDGGFDIAIGNPPYVRQEGIKHLKPTLKKAFPEVYNGTADLYTYFYAAAVSVLKPGGVLAYITPNKWFKANYGRSLRKYLSETMEIHDIIDFGELPVFKTAATYPMIFVAEKQSGRQVETVLTEVRSLDAPYPDVELVVTEQGQVLPAGAIKGESWQLMNDTQASHVAQMQASGIPLGQYVDNKIYRGVLTGLNKAFAISAEQRQQLLDADPGSIDLIKPLAVGDDVRKWHVRDKQRYLLFVRRGTDIQKYPAILEHLKQFREQLEPRPKSWDEEIKWPGRKPGTYRWYEIQDEVAYFREFDNPKIIYPDMAQSSRFTLDTSGSYFGNTTYFLASDDLYLLGILNSKIFWSLCMKQFASFKGATLRFYRQDLARLPIPLPAEGQRSRMEALVRECLALSGRGCERIEQQIDLLAEELYAQ